MSTITLNENTYLAEGEFVHCLANASLSVSHCKGIFGCFEKKGISIFDADTALRSIVSIQYLKPSAIAANHFSAGILNFKYLYPANLSRSLFSVLLFELSYKLRTTCILAPLCSFAYNTLQTNFK